MNLRKVTHFVLATVVLLLGVSYAFGSKSAVNDKIKAKARYFYLKGAISSAEENYDKAYEYYKKAFQLDPEYVDAGYDYGVHRLVLAEDTFHSPVEAARSLEYMKKMIDAYPRDIVSAESYAYYAMEADTLPEALRVYNILVQGHPGLSRLYYPQSMLNLQLGQPDSALKAMREYERLEGASSETVLRKLSIILTKNDTVAALKEVRDYALSNPGNPRVVLDEAMIYNAMEYPDTAIMILEKGLKEFPENGDMQYNLGFIYLNKGDTAKFHSLVNQALTSDYYQYEEKVEALQMYLSKLPSAGNDFKESDQLMDQLNHQYLNDVVMMNLTADYKFAKGDKNGAYEMAKKAYALDPEDPNLLGRLISYSLIAEKPKEGMKAYEAYPNEEVKYIFSLALAYIAAAEQIKEYDKALAATEKMLGATIPSLKLSTTSKEIETDTLVGKALPADLNTLSAIYEVAGDLYGRMGRKEDAVRAYENAVIIPVDNPSAQNNYAYYLVETLDVKPGTEDFEKAKDMSYESIQLTLEKPQANYYDTYAWILFKEQNYREALSYIELAVELEGDNPPAEILSHYGDILFMLDNTEEAVKQWTRALEIEPSDSLLKKKIENKALLNE